MANPKTSVELELLPKEKWPYEIPENWNWVKSTEVFDIEYGKGLPVANLTPTGYPVYGANGVIGYYTQYTQEDTRVLMTCRGATSGTINVTVPKSFVTSNSLILKPKWEADLKFVEYLFESMDKRNLISGTAQPQITVKAFHDYYLPLPPMKEQKRIAEKVERLFAKIDEAKRGIQVVKESFELRRVAILTEALKGKLGTNDPKDHRINKIDVLPDNEHFYEVPKNWSWVKIGSIFTQSKEQVLPEGNEQYIGLEHLLKGGGMESPALASGIKSNKVVFKKGDVLYGKLRPYLDKHAVVHFDGVASTDIIVFRSPHKDLNRILDYYLGLPSTIDYAISNSNGINLPRVSPKIMNELPFPLPPENEWKRLAAKLDQLINNLKQEKLFVEKIEEKLELLEKSILEKAFSGKLGTNEPTEKSAIETDFQ
jgi:type I restriction enzyme, S subunit